MADRERNRPASSKYDPVKVKVWLNSDQSSNAHYFILSRYLISRMLTVTKISHLKAVKIAMELKKQLVDSDQLEITQERLEDILFKIMEAHGFGSEYLTRYKMVNKFLQQKRPLVILICGAPCSGKSTIAQLLASRFNLPNVVQTDTLHELISRTSSDAVQSSAFWERDLDPEQLLASFKREAAQVRRAVTGDLLKAAKDGKSIIMEGSHLDPGLFLYEFGKYGTGHLIKEGAKIANQAIKPIRQQFRRSSLEVDLSNSSLASSLTQSLERLSKTASTSSPQKNNGSPEPPSSPEQSTPHVSAFERAPLSGRASFAFSTDGAIRPQILFSEAYQKASSPLPIAGSSEKSSSTAVLDTASLQSPTSEWLSALTMLDAKLETNSSEEDVHNPLLSQMPPVEDRASHDAGAKKPTISRSTTHASKQHQSILKSLLSRFVRSPAEKQVPVGIQASSIDTSPAPTMTTPQPPADSGALSSGDVKAFVSPALPAAGAAEVQADHLDMQLVSKTGGKEINYSHNGGNRGGGAEEVGDRVESLNPQTQNEGVPLPPRKSRMSLRRRGQLPSFRRDSTKTTGHVRDHLKVSFQTPEVPESAFSSKQDSSSGEEVISRVPDYLRQESDLTQTESLAFGLSEQYSEHYSSEGERELHREMKEKLEWSQRVMPPELRVRKSVKLPPLLPISDADSPPAATHPASIVSRTAGLSILAARDQVKEGSDGRQLGKEASLQETPLELPGSANTPVFVLIVLCMADRDRDMLVEHKLSRAKVAARGRTEIAACLERVRILDQHLTSYSACNVPVIKTSLPEISATADLLHDYLLECIALQMQ